MVSYARVEVPKRNQVEADGGKKGELMAGARESEEMGSCYTWSTFKFGPAVTRTTSYAN